MKNRNILYTVYSVIILTACNKMPEASFNMSPEDGREGDAERSPNL
jgi:hypothetical protein